ncbi:urea transporter [Rhodococcus sp. NPDC049939]|uniref:urea transporter n=1 Tax=Rhodococcus sp. NPDC049939 TaxID=3155511 RepID=UPI003408EB11
MRRPVDLILPPIENGRVPYYRLVLRGCSQLCFQTNELTALFFLAAVLVESPLAAAYLLIAAIIAPGGRMLLGERGDALAAGFAGLNPCLIALALPTFFRTDWTNLGMWVVLLICIAIAVVMVHLFVRIFPFPILVLPFLIILWTLSALTPYLEFLEPVTFDDSQSTVFTPVVAVLSSLGEAVLSPNIWSGLLFLVGVLLSNWRHAVVALVGASIGTTVSYYYRDVDPTSVDLGLYGFNGVLAAVGVYVLCGSQLRLAILAALVATIIMPAFTSLSVPAASAPFVFAVWLVLALGWIETRWLTPAEGVASAAEIAKTGADPDVDGQNQVGDQNP